MSDGACHTTVRATLSVAPAACCLAPAAIGARSGHGHVRALPFPRLLRYHATIASSGILSVERGHALRSIFYDRGTIAWAESSESDLRFSVWLESRVGIRDTHVEHARALVRSRVCRFGEALVRCGTIATDELATFAEEFVIEVIAGAFEWRSGAFTFTPFGHRRYEPPVQPAPAIEVERAVLAGYERMEDVGLMTMWLGDLGASRAIAADPYRLLDQREITSAHVALFQQLLAGSFTFEEAVSESPLDPADTIRLLGMLDALGVIVEV